jgi:hypothetical protein
MKYYPAPDPQHLESWQVQDGGWRLALYNEAGDVVAVVNRPDGTGGHAFGGPVYEWDGFRNWWDDPCGRQVPNAQRRNGLTDREKSVAAALGRRVGWSS